MMFGFFVVLILMAMIDVMWWKDLSATESVVATQLTLYSSYEDSNCWFQVLDKRNYRVPFEDQCKGKLSIKDSETLS